MKTIDKVHDFYGHEIQVGDILLGAKGRQGKYVDTEYHHVLVIGRTPKMLRVHDMGIMLERNPKVLLDQVKGRYGRQGGKANGLAFIRIAPSGITEAELNAANKKAVIPSGATLPSGFLLQVSTANLNGKAQVATPFPTGPAFANATTLKKTRIKP